MLIIALTELPRHTLVHILLVMSQSVSMSMGSMEKYVNLALVPNMPISQLCTDTWFDSGQCLKQ